MMKKIYLFLFAALFSTSMLAQLPCATTAKYRNIGGGTAALVLPYAGVANANMIQTTDQTVHITNFEVDGEVIRDLGGANIPISVSLNPPTAANFFRLNGPQIRMLDPALPATDRGVFTGTITISNDNNATTTVCHYVNGDLVAAPPPPSGPELLVSSVNGLPLTACDGTLGVTLAPGQNFNVGGTFNPPAGETATNIKIKHQVFTAGFGNLEHSSESSYDNPTSPFGLSHTVDLNAPTSMDFPIHIIQTVVTFSDGSSLLCNAFITVSLPDPLPCTATAKYQNIGGGTAALTLPYASIADASMIQTTDQTVHLTSLNINGEVIRDLGGANVPISVSLNPPTSTNLFRLNGPQIRMLDPSLPVADRGVFTGTIVMSNDNNITSTLCTYVNGDLVPNPPPSIPTMGEWGLIILGLLTMIIGVVAIRQRKLALAGGHNENISLNSLPFNKTAFGKNLWIVAGVFLAIFTISITVFGYELTSADIPGSFLSIPLVAYLVTLIKQ